MRLLAAPLIGALLLLGAAAADEPPSGVFEVVAIRAASDTASTLAARDDEALRRQLGRRLEIGKQVRFPDDRPCLAPKVRPGAEPWPTSVEPNLSDLQLRGAGPDRRLNRAWVIDCGGRAIGEITPVLRVDRRVLVIRSRNGAAYLVLEAPLEAGAARKVEQALARAGFDPGRIDGRLDAAARRALGRYAQAKGAAFAFAQGVLTETVLAGLVGAGAPP